MFWAWKLLKVTMVNFMSDKALSHGAAIAYYTVFAIAPLLVIVIAVAGLRFGERAAQGAIASQLSDLMGDAGARGIEALIRSASNRRAGLAATAVGFGTLILAASSVFIEMQSALNAIWKTKTRHMSIRAFVRARLHSGAVPRCVSCSLDVWLAFAGRAGSALARRRRLVARWAALHHGVEQPAQRQARAGQRPGDRQGQRQVAGDCQQGDLDAEAQGLDVRRGKHDDTIPGSRPGRWARPTRSTRPTRRSRPPMAGSPSGRPTRPTGCGS